MRFTVAWANVISENWRSSSRWVPGTGFASLYRSDT